VSTAALALAVVTVLPAATITRAEIVERAANLADHTWRSTAANQQASCATSYESDYEPGEHVGLPYAWGGFMDEQEFDQRIAAGEGAGSHSWHGVLSCVAGVDCSGLVSHAWDLDTKHGTSTLDRVSAVIPVDDVRPGDAFNKPGSHVVLYIGDNDAGEPLFYEAAGGASRVRLHSGWAYLDGYTPIRFDEVQEVAATPTPAEPERTTPARPAGDAPCAGLERRARRRCLAGRADPSPGSQPSQPSSRPEPAKPGGCGCGVAGAPPAVALPGLILVAGLRRRRR